MVLKSLLATVPMAMTIALLLPAVADAQSAATPKTSAAANSQFVVISRTDKSVSRTYDAAQLKALIAEDVAHTKALYASGVLRQMWSRRDDAGAVQLFEAKDVAAVRAALAGYPMVTKRIVQVDIYPIAPYGGFTGAGGGNDAAVSMIQ